jgi:NDP-sugar pyrophosphorylase family protein
MIREFFARVEAAPPDRITIAGIWPMVNRPLIDWAVRTVQPLLDGPPVLVVGHGREQVQQYLGNRCQYVVQEELLGTGHAVWQAEQKLRGAVDAVLVDQLCDVGRVIHARAEDQPRLAILAVLQYLGNG